jgi:GH18 family chitinase
LAFLAILKNLLPGRTVAIAAPASYWYLKQFPIKEISRVVDYIVYMTYDLHGQVSFPPWFSILMAMYLTRDNSGTPIMSTRKRTARLETVFAARST